MAQVRPIKPARLVAGIIAVDDAALELPIEPLEREFGPIDLRSGIIPFDFTDYYEKEMGSSLKRQLISFERLIDPPALADAKLFTNGLEMKLLSARPMARDRMDVPRLRHRTVSGILPRGSNKVS